jgi:hypothetical protein
VNGSLIKFFHKNPAYVPRSNPKQKPLKESGENTNQHDTNDPTKLAEEECDHMDTRLAKYDQNSE